MTTNTFIQEIQNLGAASKRSISRQLLEILPDIENAIASGVSAKDILLALEKIGLKMSEKTFRGTLYRLRKRQKKAGSNFVPTPFVNEKTAIKDLTKKETAAIPLPTSLDGELKTLDQLKIENPRLTLIQLAKLDADQYKSREWKYTG